MLEDLTLFAMARRSMAWLTRREDLLAQNVANVDTPKYQAKDLNPVDFKDLLKPAKETLAATVTDPKHIQPKVESTQFTTMTERHPEESKLDGNQVLLEEQMQKVGEVRDAYQLATSLTQANMGMIRTALGQGTQA
jgi:flagellar basal-body rod protein FlgB